MDITGLFAYPRIVVCGGPNCGKSTLAAKLVAGAPAYQLFATDDLVGRLEWGQDSAYVADLWFSRPGPWIVEGVTACRALRKWLDRNEHGVPCDAVVWLANPMGSLKPGQAAMLKGCTTVFCGIGQALVDRGVSIVRFP